MRVDQACPSRGRRRRYAIESLEPRALLAADPIITEFVADNDGSLLDGDGRASDWIEIFNAGDATVDLGGWTLTDGVNAWPFPSRSLGGGEYLVVFASDKATSDYVDAAGYLHTNFALAAGGEYLALLRPDQSVASQFAPAFAAQFRDVSYGPTMATQTTTLLSGESVAHTLIPAGPVANWTGGDEPFDDNSWTAGTAAAAAVGYADASLDAPGLVAEWKFETVEGVATAGGLSAVGQVDETAGSAGGPFHGTADGTEPVGGGLVYRADTPPSIAEDSEHSLFLPAPENGANHAAIALNSTHPIAQLPLGDFRVEAWFKTTDTGRSILTGSYSGSPTSVNLELHTSNRGRIWIQGPTATSDLNVTLPTNSRDNQWHHLAGVRQGNAVRLYYDGALVGSMTDVAGSFTISQGAMYIGRDSRLGETVFNGALDNVRFYASADTSAPVAFYDFETTAGVLTVEGQAAIGQIDETATHAGASLHATGFSAQVADGIDYAADRPAVLTDSTVSLRFDENNSNPEYVRVGMPQAIAELTLGDFSVQTWFKSTDTARGILMGSYVAGANALNLELFTNNQLRFYIQNAAGSTTDLRATAPTNSRDGGWHSVTGVRRGTDVELYYDGALIGSTTDVSGSFTLASNPFYLGRDSRTDATRFSGSLDNVRLWNAALTAEQVAAMDSGATPGEVTGSALGQVIRNNVDADMRSVNATALVRIPFEVTDPAAFDSLLLSMQYDDGFVAYLNGHEVARANAPDTPAWDSAATAARADVDTLKTETFAIYSPASLLQQGTNVLAIQGLNVSADDGDFLVVPRLQGVATTVETGELRYFPTPTPGGPNGDGVLGFVADTSFSVDRGFYSAGDLAAGGVLENGIVIASATPGASIAYTLDGSAPSPTHGTIVAAVDDETPPAAQIAITATMTLRAMAFKTGFEPTNVDTQTYVLLESVLAQPANPSGFPTQWQSGINADYGVDPDVVNSPTYAPRILDALRAIPTMSIVMDVADVFGQPAGLYSNSVQAGPAWERAASLEYFDPNQPDQAFQIDAAVRMHGKGSRIPERTLKHNFRFIFKEPYGPTKLDFPLFAGSAVDKFDTLLLRAGYNYSWNHNSATQRQKAEYARDTWTRDTFAEMGNLSVSGDYVHLYVNGLYWGVYQTNERPDASFLAQHLGGDKSEYDALNGDKPVDGDRAAWDELLNRVRQDMTVQANYDAVLEMLDVDNLIDYMLLQIYGGTVDWPVSEGQITNYYTGRKREDGAKFQFFVWDAEHVNYDVNVNRTGVSDTGTVAEIYSRLRANADFRLRFADHAQRHLFGDGVLTPEKAAARHVAIASRIGEALIGESARWGDQKGQATPHTVDAEWQSEMNWLVNTYYPQRTAIVIDQLRSAGLLPDVAAPTFLINGMLNGGGEVVPGDMLSMRQGVDAVFVDTPLVSAGASARVLIATSDALSATWTSPGFVADAAWTDGSTGTGVGYERGTGYEALIGTDVGGMYNVSRSVLIRIPFTHDGAEFDRLALRMKYDDGFIAYLNGVEVFRSSNVSPASNGYDAVIAANQEATTTFVVFDISAHRDLLVSGENLLAVHGINRELDSSDFLMLPELVGGIEEANPSFDPIYFTVDGADPRLSDGTINPAAMLYAGALPLTAPTHVLARARDASGVWSALGEATYSVAMPIRISELMYHPGPRSVAETTAGFASDEDFEFIELLNVSPTATVNLAGVRFSEGIEFTFGDVALPPLGRIVLAQRADAFAYRYGPSVVVAGEYGTTLQQYRLSNGGERLTLVDAVGVVIQSFDFDDGWYPQTDGDGYSLVAREPSGPLTDWNDAAAWRASFSIGGSPGTPDGLPGDANGDLRVDLADLARVQVNLGLSTGATFADGDFNGDGAVDRRDIALLAKHFGRNEAPLTPAAALLATAGNDAANASPARTRTGIARREESTATLTAIRFSRRRVTDSHAVDVALQTAEREFLRGVRPRLAALDANAAVRRPRALGR